MYKKSIHTFIHVILCEIIRRTCKTTMLEKLIVRKIKLIACTYFSVHALDSACAIIRACIED